jgi:hypothetical protein
MRTLMVVMVYITVSIQMYAQKHSNEQQTEDVTKVFTSRQLKREMADFETTNNVLITQEGVFNFKQGIIIDASGKKEEFFRTQRYIYVNPDTEYEISFAVNITVNTGALTAGVILFSNARDELDSKNLLLPVYTNGLEVQKFKFTTDHLTRYLRFAIFSDNPGTFKAEFQDTYLKQISESGKNASLISLFQTDKLDLSTPYTSHSQVLQGSQYCNISFEGNWVGYSGEALLTLQWFAAGKALGESYCYIRNIKGVEPQWDGVRVEWKRKYNDSADGISNYLTTSIRQENGKGSDKFVYKLKIPSTADSFQIKVSDNKYSGELVLYSFAVVGMK